MIARSQASSHNSGENRLWAIAELIEQIEDNSRSYPTSCCTLRSNWMEMAFSFELIRLPQNSTAARKRAGDGFERVAAQSQAEWRSGVSSRNVSGKALAAHVENVCCVLSASSLFPRCSSCRSLLSRRCPYWRSHRTSASSSPRFCFDCV